MGRHGIQISQEGIPLKRAADYQKVLDDRWPFLDIVIDQEFFISKADFTTGSTYWWVKEIVSHNLGYVPAFMFREVGTTVLDDPSYSLDIVATDDKIYLQGLYFNGDPTTPINFQILLRVFACDISAEFTNPIEKISPRARTSAKKYGVKILKPGSNGRISDSEMSEFSLHTNSKALAIQQTGLRTAGAPNYTVVVNHGLGYPPTYFLARYQTPAQFAAATVFADPLVNKNRVYGLNSEIIGISTATTSTLTVRGAQAALEGTFAFLILKDPIEVAA